MFSLARRKNCNEGKSTQLNCRLIDAKLAYLNPRFAQLQPHGQLFAGKDIWILSFFKGLFQLMQLKSGEGGARPANLSRGLFLFCNSRFMLIPDLDNCFTFALILRLLFD